MRQQSKIVKDYIEQYGMESLLFEIKFFIARTVNKDVSSGRGIDEYLYKLYDDIEVALEKYQKRNSNA